VATRTNRQGRDTLSKPEDGAPHSEWFAELAAAKDHVLSCGIVDRDEFNAAMSRQNKSDALLAAMASWLGGPGLGRADLIVTALLDNPELRQGDLRDLIRVVRASGHTSAAILSVLCTHMHDDTPALTAVLWQASYQVNREVAASTGLLLPAATCWVRRTTPDADGMTGMNPTPAQQALIEATCTSWAAWAGADSARGRFLRDTSFDLDAEGGDLLEVGTALLAVARLA